MLVAKELRCRRGARTVFASLSFELHPGQVLELRGANGSGKTTLLRALAGLLPLSGGELSWNGRPVVACDTEHADRTAYLGHLNGLSTALSAAENLRFSQQLAGGDGAGDTSVFQALQAWGLDTAADRPVHILSQGQRRRLALARIRLAQRTLWLLDEPCAALDNAGESLFDAHLSEHLADGGMAVVATHRSLTVSSTSRLSIALDALPRPNSEGMLAAC
jgi:heme exporter protein A